jgi:hypothetical protein
MGMYNVEVEGRYTIVLEIEADSHDQAEENALRAFEQDVDVVTNMGGESWDWTGIVAVNEEEEDEYPEDIEFEVGVR